MPGGMSSGLLQLRVELLGARVALAVDRNRDEPLRLRGAVERVEEGVD